LYFNIYFRRKKRERQTALHSSNAQSLQPLGVVIRSEMWGKWEEEYMPKSSTVFFFYSVPLYAIVFRKTLQLFMILPDPSLELVPLWFRSATLSLSLCLALMKYCRGTPSPHLEAYYIKG